MSKIFARELRRHQTEAERRFWSIVRGRRLEGLRFRRQQVFGPFIVDFVCVEVRLIVELDGAQHHGEEHWWYDYRRTKYLEASGYRVMRFNNGVVLRYPFQVAGAVVARAREGGPSSVSRRLPAAPATFSRKLEKGKSGGEGPHPSAGDPRC
ncbi:MAG: endonuclease domain-containing protein, partial [Phycisphaerae bacterium]